MTSNFVHCSTAIIVVNVTAAHHHREGGRGGGGVSAVLLFTSRNTFYRVFSRTPEYCPEMHTQKMLRDNRCHRTARRMRRFKGGVGGAERVSL